MHNSCSVLSLDFSIVDSSGGIEDIRHRFYQQCNISLRSIIWRYGKYFGDTLEIELDEDVSINNPEKRDQVSAGKSKMKNGHTGEPGTGKRKKVTKISQFQALEEDLKQLKAYEAEWKKQHPYPGNKSFLVYCFGNQGYRMFPI